MEENDSWKNMIYGRELREESVIKKGSWKTRIYEKEGFMKKKVSRKKNHSG